MLAVRIDNAWNYQREGDRLGLPVERPELLRQLRRHQQERLPARRRQAPPDAAALLEPRHDRRLRLRQRLRHPRQVGDRSLPSRRCKNEHAGPRTFTLRGRRRGRERARRQDDSTAAGTRSRPARRRPSALRPASAASTSGAGATAISTTSSHVLKVDGKPVDAVTTRTGFRKTEFGRRHGQAQRPRPPAQGLRPAHDQRMARARHRPCPPWLSDFSNRLMVESGRATSSAGCTSRRGSRTSSRATASGCMQAHARGRRRERRRRAALGAPRCEVMRDAIIYNRNNPSVIFYEAGNEGISEEHMAEMKAIRDKYDPHGGRAVGSPRDARQQASPSTAARCSTSTRARASRCGRRSTRRDEGAAQILGRVLAAVPQGRRRAAAPRAGRLGLQPQPGLPRDRERRALVRLLARAARHGRARQLRRRQHHLLRHQHPLPRRGELPPQRRGRRHAAAEGRLLRPPGDVGRLGRRRAAPRRTSSATGTTRRARRRTSTSSRAPTRSSCSLNGKSLGFGEQIEPLPLHLQERRVAAGHAHGRGLRRRRQEGHRRRRRRQPASPPPCG